MNCKSNIFLLLHQPVLLISRSLQLYLQMYFRNISLTTSFVLSIKKLLYFFFCLVTVGIEKAYLTNPMTTIISP